MELKRLRTEKGLSQEQLAKMVGCQRGTITMIEIGKNHPSVHLAKKLAEALECDWRVFFD